MKLFIKKVSVFLLLFLFFSVLASSIMYSFPVDYITKHKNTIIEQKLDSIKMNNYNVIFFGSSITFRHFNATLFDSLTQNSFSYNAGIPALFPFRQFDFVKEALDDNKKYKLVFYELSNIDVVSNNYDLATFHYSINFNRYLDIIRYPFQINSGYKTYPYTYTRLFLYKYCGLGIANHLRLLFDIDSPESSIPPFAMPMDNTKNGFSPADKMLESNNPVQKEFYKIVRNNFENSVHFNTESIIKEFTAEEYSNTAIESCIFNEYLNVVENIKKHAEKVVIVIPPRSSVNKILTILKYSFTAKGYEIWDFSDPLKYPDLYLKEFSFDLSHLNYYAADIYSEYLANRYNMLSKSLNEN